MAVRSLNMAQVMGNLTADPQIKTTNNGTTVATFSVATNREYTTSEGEHQESADFHNIVAFGKLAEICQNLLQKGSMVYIKGRLQTRTWDDADSGKKNYRTEIVSEDMVLLARGKPMAEGAGNSYDSSSTTPSPSAGITVTDDIPDDGPAPKKVVKKEEEVDAEDIPF